MVEISFCISEIRSYQSGVNAALGQVDKIEREVSFRANEELRKAEELLRHVNYVLDTMESDRKTAYEVKEHNQTVLSKMRSDLQKLKNYANELKSAYNSAQDYYRTAAEQETRIHNTSVRSTGDSATDYRLEQMRAKQLQTAQAAVKRAKEQISQIKEQQSVVQRQIETLQRNIEQVERIIEQLSSFIYRIQQEIESLARYRGNLEQDMHQLRWAFQNFSMCYTNVSLGLNNCDSLAEKAANCGQNICRYLLDDGSLGGGYDSYQIVFRDLRALSTFGKELESTVNRYEDAEDEVARCAAAHSSTMQDNVISETTKALRNVCSCCGGVMDELRCAAKNCRKANAELQTYYELKRSI